MTSIYKFSESLTDWTSADVELSKKVLGGKGAGLTMMCVEELPVPPGFIITTDVCNQYRSYGVDKVACNAFIDKLMQSVVSEDQWLEAVFGYSPLVSVRSGAPVSMPGMMDTILNVGITDETLPSWSHRLGARSALDSYRRLIQMLGHTAYGVPMEAFEKELIIAKAVAGVELDSELNTYYLTGLVASYKKVFQAAAQMEFPQTREAQMEAAIKAVFNSWMNPRAIEYRKINKIDEAMGTAVIVQAMVFGNMGEDSGTGVLFSRDPSTGENKLMGEFLTNAQGEDVVAGIRTPVNLDKMSALGPAWAYTYIELVSLASKLEAMYKDMVDVEFTVQQGKLYVLQSRTGKRGARAAFKIATDFVVEKVISKNIALSRLTVDQFKVVRRPSIDPKFNVASTYTGLPACPGVVSGVPVFSSEAAIASKEPCILVTHETTPDDIAGMNAAVGILTQTGGATSHAAVVARAMDKCCITGCTSLDLGANWVDIKKVTLDGSTGRVWLNVDVPVIDSSDAVELKVVAGWCMELLKAVEIAPTVISTDHPHRIAAAYWWGNTVALNAVLDALEALPTREHVSFDLTPPAALSYDVVLADCFGTCEDEDFHTVLHQELGKRAGALNGLKLTTKPAILPASLGSLYATDFVKKSMPIDYAVFAVLGL